MRLSVAIIVKDNKIVHLIFYCFSVWFFYNSMRRNHENTLGISVLLSPTVAMVFIIYYFVKHLNLLF